MEDATLPVISLEAPIAAARARLRKPEVPTISSARALGAAALAAISALSLAAAVIMGPGIENKHAHTSESGAR